MQLTLLLLLYEKFISELFIELLLLLLLCRSFLGLLLRMLQFCASIRDWVTLVFIKPTLGKVVLLLSYEFLSSWTDNFIKSSCSKINYVNAAISNFNSCNCSDSLNIFSWLLVVSVEPLLVLVVFSAVSEVSNMISGFNLLFLFFNSLQSIVQFSMYPLH